MIESFDNRLTEELFFDRHSRLTRRFPSDLRRAARRKLQYLNDAVTLNDLRAPPGNRLEALRGVWSGYWSVRINDQWRMTFRWFRGLASDVAIVDYH